jgi:hypothetical protein
MKRRGRRTKADAQRSHARRRMAERYDLNLTPQVRTEIVAAIRSGRSTPVARQSNRVIVHDIAIRGETVRVVYDRKRAEIITVLPPGAEVWGVAL